MKCSECGKTMILDGIENVTTAGKEADRVKFVCDCGNIVYYYNYK